MSTTVHLLDAVERRLKVLETARALYRDRLTPDFNVFDTDFFRFSGRGENGLSDVLAWLLDPSGSHGQGGRFLRIFTAQAGREWPSAVCERARTRREVSNQDQDGRDRPDIVVMSGSHLLVVENKEWAGEQPGQIARYVEFMDALTGRHGILYRQLVFITPEGRQPSSLSEADRNILIGDKSLVMARYRARPALPAEHDDGASDLVGRSAFSVIEWLDLCRMECASDRVSALINEFTLHLRKRFDGVRDMSKRNAVITSILSAQNGVTSALEIAEAVPDLKNELINRLTGQVTCRAEARGWKVMGRLGSDAHADFRIGYPEINNMSFCCSHELRNFGKLQYGISRNDRAIDDAGFTAALAHLQRLPKRDHADPDWWIWMRNASPSDPILSVEGDWQTSAQPWQEIAAEKELLAGRIIAAAEMLYRALLECQTF